MLTGAGGIALSTGWAVAGGIATALGAGLMYIGGAVRSRADVAAATQDKLEDFLTRLSHLREEQSARSPQQESSGDTVEKIEEDFATWANEFGENRHHRGLQFKQAKLERQTIAAEMTAKWRPLLRRILDLLKNTLTAYNEKLGCGIEFELPEIPQDLFADPYRGVVTFGTNAVWQLQTDCMQPARRSSKITLWINFRKNEHPVSSAAATIVIDVAANEFEMFAHGAAVPVDIDMVGTPLAEFDTKVRGVIRKLVEAQLIEADANLRST